MYVPLGMQDYVCTTRCKTACTTSHARACISYAKLFVELERVGWLPLLAGWLIGTPVTTTYSCLDRRAFMNYITCVGAGVEESGR